MRKIISLTIILCSFSAAKAANYYFCDKTNNYIYLGDSIARVKQMCGDPITSITKVSQAANIIKVTRWTYNVTPSKPYTEYKLNPDKGILTFDFDKNHRLVQILLKGKQLQQTTACLYQQPIKIGDSSFMVVNRCWMPNSIQHLTIKLLQNRSNIQTILTYQSSSYMPTTTLIFQNNKLTSISP
ncbi:MAG: DUF2845 domain-containing protein [Gammaproteobacteria bacterium]|jgi:hypothetical protein